MFGYVVVNREELTNEQSTVYHANYCGLCQELKKQFGAKGQMLLNYDMVFLILILNGLYEPESSSNEFKCLLHPSGKKIAISNEIITYAAKMNVLLAYYDCLDDWNDNRSVTKKAVYLSLTKEYEKIKAEYPEKEKAVADYISKLQVAESGNEVNIDAVSGLTGEMMAELFDMKPSEWSQELRSMAFYLGKYIYLIDAYVDMKKDSKKGLYNIFNSRLNEGLEKDMDLEVHVELLLRSMMAECSKSFERMPIVENADILRNILYSGIWTKFEIEKLKNKK